VAVDSLVQVLEALVAQAVEVTHLLFLVMGLLVLKTLVAVAVVRLTTWGLFTLPMEVAVVQGL
jgi:hypothetical protein